MTDSEDEIDVNEAAEAPPPPPGVGPQLRAAREKKGLTLDQLAAETRISRHALELIEAGNFTDLAGRTYAVGFAKTFAKAVGLDQGDVAAMVRAEMDELAVEENYDPAHRRPFEPGDPARSPGGGLLWFSLFAIVVLLVGIFFAARALFTPAAEMPSLIEQQEQEEAAALAEAEPEEAEVEADAPVDASGAVVFTAQGETWVRFYEADGRVLQEGTMRQGDSFTIPADAVAPQIITGRPDLLAITVGGSPVRKLSNDPETLQDVAISAEALLARPSGGDVIGFRLGTGGPVTADEAPTATPTRAPASRPTATPSPSPTPAATATPRPTASASATATPEPSTAATAPPRAEPAEPAENPVSPPV
ncbi:helix-turn-helix domain-containing protein [Aurantiacibacter gilvus]|uniref:RodZ domain-containing protein n=1 Tax=Aurantiacibacter gilvus TaxID=3139141 RepID=A0ABU9IC61_9SPHN